MKTVKFLLFVMVITLCSSCALHSGYITNSASLSQANFDYVHSNISGYATTTHVLGIGGLDKHAIVEEAKQSMLLESPLRANQALANVSVNWKHGYYILWVNIKCTVTADVVEFHSSDQQEEMRADFDRLLFNETFDAEMEKFESQSESQNEQRSQLNLEVDSKKSEVKIVDSEDISNDHAQEELSTRTPPQSRDQVSKGDKLEINIGTKKNPIWVEGTVTGVWFANQSSRNLTIQFYDTKSNKNREKGLTEYSQKWRLPIGK